ncbi:MAG: hypothetical protein ACREJ9_13540 [Candidatus Rokuibacteriota bacterium]
MSARVGAMTVLLAVVLTTPVAAHHVGTYVPRDNAISANFKQIKFAVQARKFDVALRLFERGDLRTEMRARAARLPAGLPAGLEAATRAALERGDAADAEGHLMLFFSALARDLARDAERQLAEAATPPATRLAIGQRFLEAIWRYYNLIDFAVSTRDSKTSVAMRLAFDEAETYAKTPAAPGAAPTVDPDKLRGAFRRMAQILSDLIAASSTSARRDS